MLDLSQVTDSDVLVELDRAIAATRDNQADRKRILGASRQCASRFTFVGTRTYPRPDHPDPNKRRSLLFLLCGIIVSLRTTLENEQLAMSRLMNAVHTDDELLELTVEQIAALIRPAGMANSKAQRIYESIRLLEGVEGGPEGLLGVPMIAARNFLLGLPGVGPKAADCLLTIGLGMPSMVVDTNVFRSINWILSGGAGSSSFSNQAEVAKVKARVDKALAGESAFLFQIVHTELLLLSKAMGRRGHTTELCVGPQYCKACATSTGELMLPLNS
ncbi:hypothetical protein FEZ32_06250 [Acidipropionibacterium jensenii]|uniref:endonuclease III domain-containing protein n=1 Tax=Acidipropionibacterium jensenii TaxID=1749 RepID=UPI00110AD9BE|nr:hypothetical protein [Acidipropionibacterium jensenii]QCV88015.1 hypothetical protein FEZ32_06250 [Acidipropionibacterium jensenii]